MCDLQADFGNNTHIWAKNGYLGSPGGGGLVRENILGDENHAVHPFSSYCK